MADLGRRDVEILVHATAPSRGQDDARYRALAQAYLNFEAATSHRLSNEPELDSEASVDAQASSQLQAEYEQSTLEERESEASYRPDEDRETTSAVLSSISIQNRAPGFDSPILSFSSALDNADSPVWHGLLQNSAHTRPNASQSQHISHASAEVADSQPEVHKTISAFSSPTRILELYLQQVQTSEERSSSFYEIATNEQQIYGPSPDLPCGIQYHHSPISETMKGRTSLNSLTPSSPSPQKRQHQRVQRFTRHSKNNTPSTQDPAISTKRKWPESRLDDSHASSSAPTQLSIESSIVTTRTTRSRKRQRMDGSVDELTRTHKITSTKVSMVTTSSAPSIETKSTWAEKLEIRPSPPPTSTKDLTPEMLVTPSLQQIAQKMPLAMLFRPKIQARGLRPMERGHWVVKCGKWDSGVRKRCWKCLGNFIKRGLVGWGVWCVRDEELDTIKVYCWGTIVGHVYLLLYMASESKIKTIGACWIGGDGKAIITMPA